MAEKRKTNGRANRNRGHGNERRLAAAFKPFFPNVATSRAASRHRDNQGIDLCHCDEGKFGQMPITVQSKSSTKPPAWLEIMKQLEGHPMPTIFWSACSMSKGGKAMERGRYVFMKEQDFWEFFAAWCEVHGLIEMNAEPKEAHNEVSNS